MSLISAGHCRLPGYAIACRALWVSLSPHTSAALIFEIHQQLVSAEVGLSSHRTPSNCGWGSAVRTGSVLRS